MIKLKTGAGETDIFIPGFLEKLHDYHSTSGFHPDKKSTVLLVDENVIRYHADKIEGYHFISVKSGESSKSLEKYSGIFQKLMDLGVDRTWKIVGIGGGITTDLAGFVASTYFRGVPFGFVSTTLLGQVDAAIGGKNGINYKGFKNLIGIIRQPDFVICDLNTLKTLPKNEFSGGFSEIIKYAFIRRADLFEYLNENMESALNFDMNILDYLINESVKTKVRIVQNDETEKGERKLLNFGHTFGHALEKLYGISHGEAVAIGMVMAAKLSVTLGIVSADVIDMLEGLLRKAGLPVQMEYDADNMAEVMTRDKKRRGKGVDLILLQKPGDAIIREVPLIDLKTMVHDLC